MINRWILLLMISTALVSTEEYLPDGNVSAEKRSSMMEFQPIQRGKKSLTAWDGEELSKRALMGFQGMRGKKNSIIAETENQLFPAETNKRAPMGFQAMRGKKSLEEILDEIDKRAIDEFDGSTGKEMYSIDYTDDYDARRTKKDQLLREWEKKAPMGFQGMRGKKMILDKLEQLDGRGVIDFQGIQNMGDMLDNYFHYSISPSDFEKRDTYYRKGAQNAGEPFKRAPMRFHGMRGKRDAIEGYKSNSRTLGTSTRYYQGTSNRGNDLATYELEKRSPFGYLAARGKKNPRWEFRGKFVGVRGKKSSSALQTEGQNRHVF